MRERTAQLCLQAMAMACPSPASMPDTLAATCRYLLSDNCHTDHALLQACGLSSVSSCIRILVLVFGADVGFEQEQL